MMPNLPHILYPLVKIEISALLIISTLNPFIIVELYVSMAQMYR